MPRRKTVTNYPESFSVRAAFEHREGAYVVTATTEDGTLSYHQKEPDRLGGSIIAFTRWLDQVQQIKTGISSARPKVTGTRAERKSPSGRSPFTKQNRR